MRSDLVGVPGRVRGETERAYRFHGDNGVQVWLPKSQVEWDQDAQTMAMPEWLAQDKGLI